MPDPACASPSGSPLRRRSVKEPACCDDNSFENWLAPAGFETRSDRPASSDGTAAVVPFCAAARSTPRNEAICVITSGVRNCITSEVRLTAMAISPLWLMQDCFAGLAGYCLHRASRLNSSNATRSLSPARLFNWVHYDLQTHQ